VVRVVRPFCLFREKLNIKAQRLAARHSSGSIDFEDRHRNVEGVADFIEKPLLLPRVVIRGSESDEEVVGLELPHDVVQSSHGRLVSNLSSDFSLRRDGFDMAEHGRETIVGLVPSSVGVGRKPSEPADKNRCDHDDLGGGLDQGPNQWGKLFDVRCGLAGRDQ
jgi:hypothetical protein